MPCKSEGAQISGTKTISHLRGSAGLLPHEILEFLTPDSASEASYSRFVASFIVQGVHTLEGGALVFESGGRKHNITGSAIPLMEVQ